MTNKNTEGDSWGQLLSDFGIEDIALAETARPVESKGVESATAAGQPEELSESVESQGPKERKSVFSRFPKINFFGTPPVVSLDAVIEGANSPSIGGKAFTSNKLETMPVSQERIHRQKKDRREKGAADEPDAWTTVASQIDVLASGGDAEPQSERRPSRRAVASMFDEPVPESDEFRALKDMMEEQPRRGGTQRGAFIEEKSDVQRQGRGRRKPPMAEKEGRGRGSRYRPPVEVDDLPESGFEPIDDEPVVSSGRGRRGSGYTGGGYRDREPIRDDVPQEEWSEVDAALQAGSGGRHQRSDKRRRPDRVEHSEESMIDRESLGSGDSGIVAIHGDLPSWDDAIGDIIASNIARHKGHAGRGRR